MLINQRYIAIKTHNDAMWVKMLGVTIIPYLYFFLMGIIFQKKSRSIIWLLKGRVLIVLLIYILVIKLTSGFGLISQGNNINPLSALFLALLVFSIAYSWQWVSDSILKGNDISYGIYIYHMLVINVFVHYNRTHRLSILFVSIIVTVMLAILSWRFIEKPALSFKSYSIQKEK